jgi:hypothetical protein
MERAKGENTMMSQLIAARKVKIKALVYVNTKTDVGNGLDYFLHDMMQAGVDTSKLVEGEHYELNHTDETEFLRPYTGEVWINSKTSPELMREIAPLVMERQSHPSVTKTGLKVYNNPLFRACVKMAAWPEAMPKGFLPHCDALGGEVEKLLPEAKNRLMEVMTELKETRSKEAHSRTLADAMRNVKARESAQDYAAKARRFANRSKALEGDKIMLEQAFGLVAPE